MSRTREEIEQVIQDAKDADAVIGIVDSVSSTSVWLAIKKVVAYAIWVFENLWDKYQMEINNSSSAAVYAHDDWWITKMYQFQYGDALAIQDIDGKKLIYYPVVDPTKQIIKRASIKDDGKGGSIIKIATDSGALTTPQLNAARSFVDRQIPAGSKIDVRSTNTDLAKYFITIYYDALYLFDDLETAVKEAIDNYHKNLDFDGGVDLRKLEDELQKITAVVSFVTTNAEAKSSGGVYSSFNRRYETISGYIKVDDDFPATSVDNGGTITYIPNI